MLRRFSFSFTQTFSRFCCNFCTVTRFSSTNWWIRLIKSNQCQCSKEIALRIYVIWLNLPLAVGGSFAKHFPARTKLVYSFHKLVSRLVENTFCFYTIVTIVDDVRASLKHWSLLQQARERSCAEIELKLTILFYDKKILFSLCQIFQGQILCY